MAKTTKPNVREPARALKGGEFKKASDHVNNRTEAAPSLSDTDWANLSPKDQEKRQRG
jgi:hypothetical protein